MKSNCKKTLAILLAVLMLVCAFPFAVFAEGEHTHNFIKEVKDAKYLKTAGTCMTEAVYYKSCECGLSASGDSHAADLTFKGDKDPNNHTKLKSIGDNVESTCSDYGIIAAQECEDCHTKIPSKRMDKKPHIVGTPANCVEPAKCKTCGQSYGAVDPNNHKQLVKDPAVTANCKEPGKTEGQHCEACKKVITAQQPVPKTDKHTPKTVNKKATCTEAGVEGREECAICGLELKAGKVLLATGHKWVVSETPAGFSCAAGGTISHTCSVCQKSETVTLKPGQHDEVPDAGKPATCTEAGLSDGSHCSICKAPIKEQTVIPAAGHNFTGEISPNKDGTHSFKCVICQEVGGPVKCTDLDRNCICELCNEAIPHAFSVYNPDGNATCLQDGTKTSVCDICGKAKDTQPDVGSKDRAEHQFKFVAQNDAGCLTNAHEIGTCTLCGTTMTREIENTALGHDESDWKYPEGFNCEDGGTRFKECKRCGAKTAEEPVAAAQHTIVTDAEVKVTCTVDGKTEGAHCSVCGWVKIAQAVIPAEGHKADSKGFTLVKAASCTAKGEEKANCSVCGESFTREISATGHKYAVNVVRPTCTTKGYTSHKCSVCGHTYNDNKVKATGHNWKITVKQATMKKAGAKVYVCTVCKKKVTKTIDMITTVKLSKVNYAKTGKKVTPTLVVKNSAGKKLKEGTAYTVKYSGNRKVLGTYTMTVTFIGNYAGKKTLKFRIVPAAPKTVKATVSGKTATVNWSQVSGGDKYVVYCSTTKDGTYKKVGTTTKTSLPVKNLKAGNYYFKVRAIRVLDSGSLNGFLSSPVKAKVK